MSVGYPKYIEGLKKVRLETSEIVASRRLPPSRPLPTRLLTYRALLLPLQYQEAWKAAYAKLPTTPLTPLTPLNPFNPFNPFNVTMPEWPKLEMPSTATATAAGAYHVRRLDVRLAVRAANRLVSGVGAGDGDGGDDAGGGRDGGGGGDDDAGGADGARREAGGGADGGGDGEDGGGGEPDGGEGARRGVALVT